MINYSLSSLVGHKFHGNRINRSKTLDVEAYPVTSSKLTWSQKYAFLAYMGVADFLQ